MSMIRKRQQMQLERFATLPALLPLRLYVLVTTEILPFKISNYYRPKKMSMKKKG